MVIDHISDSLNNVPEKVKQLVHEIDKHNGCFSINCNRYISSAVNTWKKIHLNSNLFDEFYTTFYNDKNSVFKYIFKKVTSLYLNEISHPEIFE